MTQLLRKYLPYFLIFISLLIFSEHFIGRLTFDVDYSKQYAAAKQIALHGINAKPEVNQNDLSEYKHQVHTEFPPGFAYVISPLFKIFSNIRFIHLIIVFSIHLAFIVLIILTFKKIIPGYFNLRNISLILFFFTINGKILLSSGIADVLCLNLILISALFLHAFLQHQQIRFLFLSCLSLSITFYFRYAYIPLLSGIPLFFLIRIIWKKTTEYRAFLFSILFIFVCSFPFAYHIYIINSETHYITEKALKDSEQVLYFKNIAYTHPFPLTSFVNIEPILRIFGYASEYGYDRGYEYPFSIHLLFYLASIIILIPILYFYRIYKQTKIFSSFFKYIGILSLTTFIFILGISIINPPSQTDYLWSWAMVSRYFFIPMLLIQIVYIILALSENNNFYRKFTRIVLLFSLIFHISIYSYSMVNYYKPYNFEYNQKIWAGKNRLHNYKLYKILEENQYNKGIVIVNSNVQDFFSSTLPYFINISNMVYLPKNEMKKPLKTTQDVPLFYITNSKNQDMFIMEYNFQKLAKIDANVYVYKTILESID